jgi:hypothetical protein
MDPDLLDFRLVIRTCRGIGEQLDILVARPPDAPFTERSRSQYLEQLRSHVRRALGFGARVQLVEPGSLPHEGLMYKTVFQETGGL